MTHILPALALLLALRPLGTQFRVNTTTTGNQYAPAVSCDPGGNFVVVWDSPGVAEDLNGIYGQRYSPLQAPLGGEFRANTYITGAQFSASVAMDPTGQFVVSWNSSGEDGDALGVYARAYRSTGAPMTNPFRVNETTTADQEKPTIAMEPSGIFLIAWEGIDNAQNADFIRRFSSLGSALGGETPMNTAAAGGQNRPAVASDASGAFVVAWSGVSGDGGGYDIFARRIGPGFTKRGGDFRVNTSTADSQSFASVSANPAGAFVVAWSSGVSYPTATIAARAYAADGTPSSAEVRVNTYTTARARPAALALPDGTFVIVYSGYTPPEGAGPHILMRHFDAAGTPLSGDLVVDTATSGSPRKPRVASWTSGFVVVWESDTGDGDGFGVFARRYSTVPLPGDENGDGVVDVADVFYLINFLFAGGSAPVG